MPEACKIIWEGFLMRKLDIIFAILLATVIGVHFSQVSSLQQQIDAQNKTIAKLERKVKSLDDTVDTLNGYVMQLQEKMDEICISSIDYMI